MDTSSQAVIGTPSTATEPTQKRQRWGVKQKRQIVEETLAVGASVARVARAHHERPNHDFAIFLPLFDRLLGTASR